MSKKATKESITQLQRLFDYLGEYGGLIDTNKPRIWPKLDLEVEDIKDSKEIVIIQFVTDIDGDLLIDPRFKLELTSDGNTIIKADIKECSEQTILGITVVDSEDYISGFGFKEKDPLGLTKRFSKFMKLIEAGPYLSDSNEVIKYEKALSQ